MGARRPTYDHKIRGSDSAQLSAYRGPALFARVEFHGNVEIRTLPRGNAVPGHGNDATQLMARAPSVIAAQNVDVVTDGIQRLVHSRKELE